MIPCVHRSSNIPLCSKKWWAAPRPCATAGRFVASHHRQNEYLSVTPYMRGAEYSLDNVPIPGADPDGPTSASSSKAFLMNSAASNPVLIAPYQLMRKSVIS